MNRLTEDRLLTAIRKGQEVYVFSWTPSQAPEMLRHLGRMASNQELSFGWCDAAAISQRVRLYSEGASNG